MEIVIIPGRVIVRDPYFGNFDWDGFYLSQVEDAALFTEENGGITTLLNRLEKIIPGAWPYMERLTDNQRSALVRVLRDQLIQLSKKLLAGNVYPVVTLLELAHSVRLWQEREEEERKRE